MLKTIFISYGRDEKNPHHVELVKRVKLDLEKEGYTILMDIERLKTGDDWQLQLESDIAMSDWILFMKFYIRKKYKLLLMYLMKM
jgi:hypothetical protein